MFSEQTEQVITKVDALRHEVDDHWQVPADEARVLAQIVRMTQAKSICEIGHSYGFSTLHLTAAAAAEQQGHVYSFDISEKKHEAATAHLDEAGLSASVTLTLGDARETLSHVTPERPYDLIFVDAVKEQSDDYLKVALTNAADRCWIITDNVCTHPKQLAPFVQQLTDISGGKTCAIPVGNGIEVTLVGKPNV